jgi:peptidoglycan/xylan/chitin deacetylase (PgdA/CDA1 family)
MFLSTGYTSDERRSFRARGCLTWSEVRELHAGGVEFGSHTVTHPRLTDLRPDGTPALELGMGNGTWSYRAFRFPWRGERFVTDVTSLDFGRCGSVKRLRAPSR